MLIETVRRFSRVAQGVTADARSGAYRETIVNDVGLGKYFEGTANGQTFVAANPAGQALSVASATATGLILSNPAGSGKAMAILQIDIGLTVGPTGVGAVCLFANVNPVAAAVVHTTPLIPRPCALGTSGLPAALVDSAATLPVAPVIVRNLMGIHWVTANAVVANMSIHDDVGGSIVVTPGCAVSVQSLTTANTANTSMTWAEVDWPLA